MKIIRQLDTCSPSSSRVHDSLASLLAECRFKVLAIVLGQEIAGDRLAAILVDSLQDLVSGSVAQTGEKRDKLATESCAGLFFEDYLVQLARACNLDS